MLLDLTFRFDVPRDLFPQMQVPLADCANQVQADRQLIVEIDIPLDADGYSSARSKGVLIGIREAF